MVDRDAVSSYAVLLMSQYIVERVALLTCSGPYPKMWNKNQYVGRIFVILLVLNLVVITFLNSENLLAKWDRSTKVWSREPVVVNVRDRLSIDRRDGKVLRFTSKGMDPVLTM